MKIILDLQALQTEESRDRGIGRYSLNLAQAFIKENQQLVCPHEIKLFYNSQLGNTNNNITQLQKIIERESELIWKPSFSIEAGKKESVYKTKLAEFQREEFIQQHKPDIIHIASLFEGIDNHAVSSINQFNRKSITVSTVYDLIPYLRKEDYLPQQKQHKSYLSKIKQLKRADHLFSISNTTKKEVVDTLKYPALKVTNISSDADPSFKKIKMSDVVKTKIKNKYTIKHEFLMFVGNLSIKDPRKNIKTLIKAYSVLKSKIQNNYQLLLVGNCSDEERNELLKYCQYNGLNLAGENQVIITGHVSNNDLIRLYNLCELLVFPSLHEGFGLPVLESMRCQTAVIASNKSSMIEVLNKPEAMFDPLSVTSIKEKIEQVLLDKKLQQRLIQHGKKQAEKFSWKQSAKTILEVMQNLHDIKRLG